MVLGPTYSEAFYIYELRQVGNSIQPVTFD